jgi:hypothetical protein
VFTDSQDGDIGNDKEDCITEEEAIEGNLKKISMSSPDNTNTTL